MINRRLEAQEHKEWMNTVKEYKEKYPLTYDKGCLTCPEIMEAIYDITKGEAVITTEVGNPDKIVVNIAGDGCFRMNLNELATASRYNIPVIEVIINNSVLGMVRQWQDLFYEERYSYTTLQDKVDFVKVSEGLGVDAKKITDIDEFKDAFKEALTLGKPMVLDCHIDLDDKVWPMVNPGGSIEDAFDKADLEAQAR